MTIGPSPTATEVDARTRELCDAYARRYPAASRSVLASLRASEAFRAVVRCWMLDCPDRRVFNRVASFAMLGLLCAAGRYARGDVAPRPEPVDRNRKRRMAASALRLRQRLKGIRTTGDARISKFVRRATASLIHGQSRSARRLHGKAGTTTGAEKLALRELWPRLHIDSNRIDDGAYLRHPSRVASDLLAALGIDITRRSCSRPSPSRVAKPDTVTRRRRRCRRTFACCREAVSVCSPCRHHPKREP